MNKTAASAAQLAKCFLLHASARTTASSQQQKLHIAYLTSWNNSIFGYELRID